MGDILRRAQPDKVPLEPGDKILLIESTDIRSIAVTPQSIPLRKNLANQTLRNETLARKNETVVIFI